MMLRGILGTSLCAAVLLFVSGSANADLITDFSGGLAGFGPTVRILDNGGATANTAAFQVNGSGTLELETTAFDNIEQYALIYNGLTLGVGDEIQLDVDMQNQDGRNIGLYVGGTAPVSAVAGTNTRNDYIAVYGQGSGANNWATRGFDGAQGGGGSEYSNVQTTGLNGSVVFVAQTALNVFEVGFYDGGLTGARTVLATRNPTNFNSADFVGIYADNRALGTTGFADNLTIVRAVPEPSSLALLGLGAVVGLVRRRKN